MYKLSLFLVVFLLITSCTTTSYFQVYKTEAPNLKLNKNLMVFEDSACTIAYDFWSENGQPTFLFYNKTNQIISIDLSECFFVINGLSYDYFQNRTYTYSSGTSRTSGNVVASENTKSTTSSTNATTSVPSYYQKLQTNSNGKASTQSFSSTQSTITGNTNSVGYSVSYAEKNIIKIPSKSGKIISEFSIVNDRYKHQDLQKYPKVSEVDSMQFTIETSPYVFVNNITYQFDAILNSKKTVQNNFYVSTILNMYETQFYYMDYEESFGKRAAYKTRFLKYKSPANFFITY